MITPLSVVALGFFLGMRHATDADHVVAVMTIVSRQRSMRPAAMIGALWGAGHTLTILVVGIAIIVFNMTIPARLGLTLELVVGVMLIGLGLANVLGTARRIAPREPTDTPLARLDRRLGGMGPYQILRPLVVGIVHGLAGSAAVALLVLATIRDTQWSVVYLLVFGLGTMAGMALLTMALAATFVYTSRQFLITNRRLQLATGMLSLGFGCLMAYQIGLAAGW